jgi:SAM-dependent methyltransferase
MADEQHLDVVRRSFTTQAAMFSGPDSVFAARAWSARSWLEPLDEAMIVLDVACGAAHACEPVAPHVRQVVGIDATPALLALGAERLRAAGIANVLLQEGDAAALPFVDRSFDLVMCRSAIHHFADPGPPVAEMARVCRPGGRVVISDLVALAPEVRDACDALHRRIDPSHVRVLLEEELADLVARSVGPLTYGQTTFTPPFPLRAMLTEQSDVDGVTAALRAELAGGPATGFAPSLDGDDLRVTFRSTVLHATRG